MPGDQRRRRSHLAAGSRLVAISRIGVAGLVLSLAACPAPERAAVDEPETQVELSEWSVTLRETGASVGPRTFVVRNTGQYAHALEIEGQGEEWKTEPIPPGDEARLTVDLRSGMYTVYCPIVDEHGDHADLGMMTRLLVP